jgi:hypothetical protein
MYRAFEQKREGRRDILKKTQNKENSENVQRI